MNTEMILRITMIAGGCLWVPGFVMAAFGTDDGKTLMLIAAPFLMMAFSLLFIEWRGERVLKHKVRMAQLARETEMAKEDVKLG